MKKLLSIRNHLLTDSSSYIMNARLLQQEKLNNLARAGLPFDFVRTKTVKLHKVSYKNDHIGCCRFCCFRCCSCCVTNYRHDDTIVIENEKGQWVLLPDWDIGCGIVTREGYSIQGQAPCTMKHAYKHPRSIGNYSCCSTCFCAWYNDMVFNACIVNDSMIPCKTVLIGARC